VSFHFPHLKPRKPRVLRRRTVTPAGDPVPWLRPLGLDPVGDPRPTAVMAAILDPAAVRTRPVDHTTVTMRIPRAPKTPAAPTPKSFPASFWEDPAFWQPMSALVHELNAPLIEMAARFDENAKRITSRMAAWRHQRNQAVAKSEGHHLQAAYQIGGTAAMVGLAAEVQAMIAANALTAGAR